MARGGPRGSFMDSLHGVRAGSSYSEVRLPVILLNTKKKKKITQKTSQGGAGLHLSYTTLSASRNSNLVYTPETPASGEKG